MHGQIFCSSCDGLLIAKQGNINIHHFCHKNKCLDSWNTAPMTKWHRDWQDIVLPQYVEVRKVQGEVYHIADICNAKGVVIEI